MSTSVYDQDGVTVHHGEALDVLRSMPDNSVHSVVADPQYGLSQVSPAATIAAVTAWVAGDRERVPDGRGFMGNDWDSFVPPPAIWDECLRVLTPGGHLLAFAGSRMADLAGLSIRLAGFEIRDGIDVIGSRISWLYGTGMPKAKTVLKPAHEPIVVARKPCAGTETTAMKLYGTGGLFIDTCRVPTSAQDAKAMERANTPGSHRMRAVRSPIGTFTRHSSSGALDTTQGRWPSNVVLLHAPLVDPVSGEVGGDACADGCIEGCAVAELDMQSGISTSQGGSRGQGGGRGAYGVFGAQPDFKPGLGDTGGASRFFPCFHWEPKAPRSERPMVDGMGHPCVKPLALIRWLTRLVTPAGGTVLDWCAGSGTTGQAARAEGFPCVLIEREAKYIPHILARIESTPADLFTTNGTVVTQ